jgi:hypothetical protein
MQEKLKITSSGWPPSSHTLSAEDQAALAGFDGRYWGSSLSPRTRPRWAGLDQITPFGRRLSTTPRQGAHDVAGHGEGRRAVVVTDGIDTSASQQDAT